MRKIIKVTFHVVVVPFLLPGVDFFDGGCNDWCWSYGLGRSYPRGHDVSKPDYSVRETEMIHGHVREYCHRRRKSGLLRTQPRHRCRVRHPTGRQLPSSDATADRRWSVVAANLDRFARGEKLENIVVQT
jgi:hypothetical protein